MSCADNLVLFNYTCLTNCPRGYERDQTRLACQVAEYDLVYFPFLISGLVLVIVAFGAKLKDERSLIVTNMIVLLAFLELIAYGVQAFHAWRLDEPILLLVTGAAIGCLLAANVGFAILFCIKLGREPTFREWAADFKKTRRWIQALAAIFSFKITRLFYSRFFGLPNFMAPYDNLPLMRKYLKRLSVFNMIATLGVLICIDAYGLATLLWGHQLYITMIETMLLAVVLIVLTLIEEKTSRNLAADGFRKLNPLSDSMEQEYRAKRRKADEMEKKLRQDALKGIIAAIRGNKSFLNPDNVENMINEPNSRRLRSLPPDGNELEELSEGARSYPLSPREKKVLDNPLLMNNLFEYIEDEFQQDNVYAEPKPP